MDYLWLLVDLLFPAINITRLITLLSIQYFKLWFTPTLCKVELKTLQQHQTKIPTFRAIPEILLASFSGIDKSPNSPKIHTLLEWRCKSLFTGVQTERVRVYKRDGRHETTS